MYNNYNYSEACDTTGVYWLDSQYFDFMALGFSVHVDMTLAIKTGRWMSGNTIKIAMSRAN